MTVTSKSILIIDDDQYLRELYQEILTEEGYHITTAGDGNEGLDKIKSKKFDLVLLDVMMPKLDGIGFLKEARKRNLEINAPKIILLTNLAHGPVLEEAQQYGAKDYLIKADLTPDQVVKKVKEYLQ